MEGPLMTALTSQEIERALRMLKSLHCDVVGSSTLIARRKLVPRSNSRATVREAGQRQVDDRSS
jgi:hypothetical protein